ncbi:MAG TPA: helix-turn-helix transcriptional regulator [Puia sp.]|jgi:AraC-like DNA-binding protein
MIKYSYRLIDFRQWLRGFSELLHVPASHGTLTIPRELGEGALQAAHLPEGISFLVLNFSLNDDLQFLSEATPSPGLCLFFNQVKASDLYIVREKDSPLSDKSPTRGHIQLYSTGHGKEMTFSRSSRMKGLGIFFPPSFLQRHVQKNILSDLFQYAGTQPAAGHTEPISFECRQLLEDIFGADPASPVHHLLLHNRALLLAEKFLSAFLTRSTVSLSDGSIWTKSREKDIEALKGIVRILSDNQLNKFPSIEALSKTAMMSSTKLKSRFKQIYGMKLYEFYNRHRLEQAKEMLKTGNFSVKQVGVNIGFSNLSNFAKAFKKEFGVLPKEVLKNK